MNYLGIQLSKNQKKKQHLKFQLLSSTHDLRSEVYFSNLMGRKDGKLIGLGEHFVLSQTFQTQSRYLIPIPVVVMVGGRRELEEGIRQTQT